MRDFTARVAAAPPLHVALAPMLPLLIFYRRGASGATPVSIVWPAVVLLLTSLAVWGVLTLLGRNARKAGLASSVLMLAGCGYYLAVDLARAAGANLLVLALYALVPLALVPIWRARPDAIARATRWANVGLLAVTVVLAGLAVRDELRVQRVAAADAPAPVAGPAASNERARPDIYVLVLEGYARQDVLRTYYGFESELPARLRGLGFFVADRAAGNYAQMGQAMAAALNMEYLHDLVRGGGDAVPLRRRLGELITRNRFFAALADAGYEITSYESEYAFLRPGPVHSRPAPLVRFTNFEYRWYEATVLPRLFQTVGMPRSVVPMAVRARHIHWLLDRVGGEPADEDRPRFVFAHLLMPHPPFAVAADGRLRATRIAAGFNDGDQWTDLARGTGERYEDGYADAVTFLDAGIPGVVNRILRRPKPAIVYVLSSHGPASRLRWESPDATGVRERLASLLAVRFPDGAHAPLHARTTPVNAFRALLNRAIGTDLPMLEDRSYFSTWERLHEYRDVTSLVQ